MCSYVPTFLFVWCFDMCGDGWGGNFIPHTFCPDSVQLMHWCVSDVLICADESHDCTWLSPHILDDALTRHVVVLFCTWVSTGQRTCPSGLIPTCKASEPQKDEMSWHAVPSTFSGMLSGQLQQDGLPYGGVPARIRRGNHIALTVSRCWSHTHTHTHTCTITHMRLHTHAHTLWVQRLGSYRVPFTDFRMSFQIALCTYLFMLIIVHLYTWSSSFVVHFMYFMICVFADGTMHLLHWKSTLHSLCRCQAVRMRIFLQVYHSMCFIRCVLCTTQYVPAPPTAGLSLRDPHCGNLTMRHLFTISTDHVLQTLDAWERV